MSFKVFQKYDQTWSKTPFKDRAIKIQLDKIVFDNQTISEYITNKSNEIADIVWNGLSDKSISQEDIQDVRKYADKLAKNYKSQLQIKSSSWERGLIRPVLERYKSGLERNKKLAKRKIVFRNEKAVRIYDQIFKFKKDKLFFKVPGSNKKIEVSYKFCGTMKNYLPHISKAMGGNLIEDRLYVARAKIPITWKYVPISALGLDTNQRSNVFTVLSNGEILPHSPELESLIEEMKTLNTEISNKNKNKNQLKTKIRQRRRKRLRKLHKQQEKLIYKHYINYIIDLVEKNKMLLCIDAARTGTRCGSYGQDKLIPLLVKECENRSIPHVLVPPKNTSKLCHKCNAEVVRDPIEISDCPNCGQWDSDLNGALNVARFGWKIWNDGIKEFYTWRNKLV